MPSPPRLWGLLLAWHSGLGAQGMWAVLSVGLVAASGVVSFAFLSHSLPKAVLGTLLVVQAAVAVTSLVGRFGLDRIVMRDIHSAIGPARHGHWTGEVSGALRAALPPSLLLSTALAGASGTVLTQPSDYRDSVMLMLLILLWCEAESLRPIAAEALRSIGHFGAGSLAGQAGRAGMTIVTSGVLLITESRGLTAALGALALPSIMMTALALLLLLRCARDDQPVEHTKRRSSRYYYRHGMPLALTGLAGIVVSNGDVLLAGAFFPSTDVAAYGAALRIANVLMLPMFASAYLLMPHISGAWSRGNPEECEPLLRRVGLLTALVTVLLAAVIVLGLDHIIPLIAGPGFQDARELALILMTGVFVNVLAGVPGDVLAYGRWASDLARICVASTIVMTLSALVGASISGELAAIAIAFSLGMSLQNVAMAVAAYIHTGIRTYPALSLKTGKRTRTNSA